MTSKKDKGSASQSLNLDGEDIHWDIEMSYGKYLHLDKILSAQQPKSKEHDEMLFLIIHHVMELWMKLVLHELSAVSKGLRKDELSPALKGFSRIAAIMKQMTSAWDVLTTLTPVDYLKFRDKLGRSSGFQSHQFRALEFMVGNKVAKLGDVHDKNSDEYAYIRKALEAPSIYDVAIQLLAKRGFEIPKDCIERDWSKPYQPNKKVEAAWLKIYSKTDTYWDLYNLGEKLTDFQHNFQLWRFHHYKTVERIIGSKRGTGGSSGLPYLAKGLEIKLFPELMDARTEL